MIHPNLSPSSAAVRILLVDDNRLGLAARRSVLEELGYGITTATGGHEALELFSGGRFDLIVADYRMPRMNGVEFIERARELRPAIPVILISGYVEALGLDERNTGADVVIQKSANEVAHLVRSVSRLLRRKTAAARKPAASERATPKARRKSV
jgi:CheY-like chemotaxis protein